VNAISTSSVVFQSFAGRRRVESAGVDHGDDARGVGCAVTALVEIELAAERSDLPALDRTQATPMT
jgi:hypothetical protein